MRFGWHRRCGVLFIALAVGSAPSLAETIQLSPSKDNTLYQDDTGANPSNGQGEHFFVGRTARDLIRRGLIAFDIAGNIPAGVTIESVTLTLHASSTRETPEIQIDLYAALSDWGEGASIADGGEGGGAPAEPGDATWVNTFYPDQLWGSEGGDFADALTASAAVSSVGFFSFDSAFDSGLVADVQLWLDQPDTNFGWVLKAPDEYFPMSAKRFDSRENAEPTFQPVLTVTYSSCGDPADPQAMPPTSAVPPQTNADPAAIVAE